MKCLFLISVQLFICLSCLAQDTLKYFVNNSGKVVSTRDSADFIRMIMPPDSNDRSVYIVKDFYTDGKIKMIGQSTSRKRIELTGTCVEYFHSGVRKRILNLSQGQVLEFYPNGKSYTIKTYDAKERQFVPVECRDSTGNVIMKNGSGNFIQYDADFKFITLSGDYQNGLKEGEWVKNRGPKDDTLKIVYQYTKGNLVSGVTFDGHNQPHNFTKIDEDPSFPGGFDAFYRFVAKNLRYPSPAVEKNVEGRVIIQFVIEKDGQLTNVHLLRGIGSGCDEEALRVVKLSPRWNPGRQNGLPARILNTMPINFNLTEAR